MGVSEKLRELRKKAGITQSELAKRSTVSQTGISAIEKGIRSPSEATILLLARGLDCSPSDLLGKEKETADDEIGSLQREAIRILSDLPESAQDQAVQYLRFLAAQQEK